MTLRQRQILDETHARTALYGERSGTVDVVTPQLVESNHAVTTCENGHTVFTVQRDGEGPAFFPHFCPLCAGTLPSVYTTSDRTCGCGDPEDCNEPKGAHA